MLTACDSPSVTMPPATARRSTPRAHRRGCWYFHREGGSAAVPAGRGSWAGARPPSLRRRPAIGPPGDFDGSRGRAGLEWRRPRDGPRCARRGGRGAPAPV